MFSEYARTKWCGGGQSRQNTNVNGQLHLSKCCRNLLKLKCNEKRWVVVEFVFGAASLNTKAGKDTTRRKMAALICIVYK